MSLAGALFGVGTCILGISLGYWLKSLAQRPTAPKAGGSQDHVDAVLIKHDGNFFGPVESAEKAWAILEQEGIHGTVITLHPITNLKPMRTLGLSSRS